MNPNDQTKYRRTASDVLTWQVNPPQRPISSYHSFDVSTHLTSHSSPTTTVYFKTTHGDVDNMYSKYKKKRKNPWQFLYTLILIASTLFLIYFYVFHGKGIGQHTDGEYVEKHQKESEILVDEQQVEELIKRDEQEHQREHVDYQEPYDYITPKRPHQGIIPIHCIKQLEIEEEIIHLSPPDRLTDISDTK